MLGTLVFSNLSLSADSKLSSFKAGDNLFEALKKQNIKLWSDYTNHNFLKELESAKLSKKVFVFYLTQNYIFLINYSKFLAQLNINAKSIAELDYVAKLNEGLVSYRKFMGDDLKNYGVNASKISIKDESLANIAYSRYLLSVGQSGDFLDMFSALMACSMGYLEIGKQMSTRLGDKLKTHVYKNWIEANSSVELESETKTMLEFFQTYYRRVNEEKFATLNEIFATTIRLEINFWQSCLDMRMDF